MALINYATREINAKVVYYGPGLSGKTTNLEQVYDRIKDRNKGKLITLPTQTDRTLFFDFLPMELGTLKNFRVRVHLYTVPGQVFYNSTRKMVLKGADGVVFVADSQPEMANENFQSIKNLEENLYETGLKLEDLPMVLQYNKRDLPECAPVEEMQNGLNRLGRPYFEAAAKEGTGVMETLSGIVREVLNDLKDRPDAHNLDMSALERGGQDKVRYIRGEFAQHGPEEPVIEPLEEAELVEEAEMVEEAELVEDAELVAEEHLEDADVLLEAEAAEFEAEEVLEAIEDGPTADEEVVYEEVEVLGPEEHKEGMTVSEAAEDMISGAGPVPGEDLWDEGFGDGEDIGEREVELVAEAGPDDPIARLDIDTIGGHGKVDFDALTRDIADAQKVSAGEDGLAAVMMSEPKAEDVAESSGGFSSDEIGVFKDIVSADESAEEQTSVAAEDEEAGFPLVDLGSAPDGHAGASHEIVMPAGTGSSESFRINQSFNLPVRITTPGGRKEVSLKFDLSIEVLGDGVGQDIEVQILPPRPMGRSELAEGHPPPEDDTVTEGGEDAFDRMMNS